MQRNSRIEFLPGNLCPCSTSVHNRLHPSHSGTLAAEFGKKYAPFPFSTLRLISLFFFIDQVAIRLDLLEPELLLSFGGDSNMLSAVSHG
jgi:hypothetical protein